MIELGRICLILSLATAGYCIAAALLGTRRELPGLVQSGRNALLATCALVLTSGAALLYLLGSPLAHEVGLVGLEDPGHRGL